MTPNDYAAPAALYLGCDTHTATAHGPRDFTSAAKALRFAIEEAAPVSLRGARLEIGTRSYSRDGMLALYRDRAYPLARKNTVTPRRHRHEH
jgi:predicted ATPase